MKNLLSFPAAQKKSNLFKMRSSITLQTSSGNAESRAFLTRIAWSQYMRVKFMHTGRYIFLSLLLTFFSLGSTASAEATSESLNAGYKNGFFISDAAESNKLIIFGHLQFRLTYSELQDAANTYQFRIPRGRLKMKGNLFNKDLSYGFHVAFDNARAVLKDFFLDYKLIPGHMRIRIGQHKRFYSRQFLLSGHNFQFIDRGISHGFSGAGRDLGLSLHSGYTGQGLEWALGIYNGVTADAPKPANEVKYINRPSRAGPMVTSRIAWNHGGIKAYQMGDLKGRGLRFALGLNAQANLDADEKSNAGLQTGVDAIVKLNGFALDAAYYLNRSAQWLDLDGDADVSPKAGHAGYVALSYHLTNKTLPAIRYHRVDPKGADNTKQEIGGVINYLINSHRLKLQVGASTIFTQTSQGKRQDWVARTQLNCVF